MSMVIVSESDGTSLVCTLTAESGTGNVSINASGVISVTWDNGDGEEIEIDLPSISIAGILSEFDCDTAE